MKKDRVFWNYLDLLFQTLGFLIIIVISYFVTEGLEKYFYRYTIFPLLAVFLIFIWGIRLGRGIERTRYKKPVGFLSKKMYESRKRKSIFIFSNDGETYTPHKEIIDEIKAGEIVHVKQFVENEFEVDEFDDIYKISMDDIVDTSMDEKEENVK